MAKTYLRAYNREIESMLDGGLFQEAVAHSLHILKTYPKHLETYRLLGKAYLELKQYSNAVDIFTRLLASVPNDFVANVGMGIIRDEENKLDEAIWHMERAFETQPSNPAIQGELQRLYARRDGSAPPRIRMTRGALAQMYLQGELYPQAISEIKGVLEEDPARSDMQVLLTRAHFRSGQKNEAAEVATSVLRRYPNCLDANRVLAEIFSADRPESAMPYRQRVYELDPYAAHVTGSLFQTAEAPESAISLEKLDWNGQPVGMPSDWRDKQGIGLPSEGRDKQPAWLQSGYEQEDTIPPAPFSDPTSARAASSSDTDDNIPDFLRNAGWGESTGAFDESKSSFDDESRPPAIAAGDLPDWVKQMAPAEPVPPTEEQGGMPDWMNRIDPGILGATSTSDASEADEPDWLKGIGEPSYNAPAEPSEADQPAWLRGPGESESILQPSPASDDQPDWLKQEAGEPEKPARPGVDASAPRAEATSKPSGTTGTPSASEKDLDDSFAWLESLAAKQGATEGLLMKPEERLEEEPDWVRQAKSLSGEKDKPPVPPSSTRETVPPGEQQTPLTDPDSTGKSGQEQEEDTFAWLEGLAAKQGATEGLLTRPEDRSQQEPDWVRQAKESGEEKVEPAGQKGTPSEAMDTASWLRSLDQAETDETSTAPVESDDTDMWLKGLEEADAQAGPASESSDDTAMWLKSLDEPEAEREASAPAPDLPDWMQNIEEEPQKEESRAGSAVSEEAPAEPSRSEAEGESRQAGPVEADESVSVPNVDTGSLPSWLRGIDQAEKQTASQEDLPAWLRDDTGEAVAEPTRIEPTRAEEWRPVEKEEPAPVAAEKPKPELKKKATPLPAKKREAQPESHVDPATRKGAGVVMTDEDPVLNTARSELSRSNIPGALDTYSKLIKRARFLDEVIFDLREALYRYPVEVSIWQSLGDAYMRANRLQDALDAYTKAEELLR